LSPIAPGNDSNWYDEILSDNEEEDYLSDFAISEASSPGLRPLSTALQKAAGPRMIDRGNTAVLASPSGSVLDEADEAFIYEVTHRTK